MRTYDQAAINEVREVRARGGKVFDATPDLGTGCSNCAQGWHHLAFVVGGPFDSPQQSKPGATAYCVGDKYYLVKVKGFACPECGVVHGQQVQQPEMAGEWSRGYWGGR